MDGAFWADVGLASKAVIRYLLLAMFFAKICYFLPNLSLRLLICLAISLFLFGAWTDRIDK